MLLSIASVTIAMLVLFTTTILGSLAVLVFTGSPLLFVSALVAGFIIDIYTIVKK